MAQQAGLNHAYHIFMLYCDTTLPVNSKLHATASLQVREALMRKVSRERVGTELDGMFSGV